MPKIALKKILELNDNQSTWYHFKFLIQGGFGKPIRVEIKKAKYENPFTSSESILLFNYMRWHSKMLRMIISHSTDYLCRHKSHYNKVSIRNTDLQGRTPAHHHLRKARVFWHTLVFHWVDTSLQSSQIFLHTTLPTPISSSPSHLTSLLWVKWTTHKNYRSQPWIGKYKF